MNSLLRCAILPCAALVFGACSVPSLPEPETRALPLPRLSTAANDTTTSIVDTGGTVATERDGATSTTSESGGQGIGTLGSGN